MRHPAAKPPRKGGVVSSAHRSALASKRAAVVGSNASRSPRLCWKPKNCIRRVRRVEKFGVNTCPPSRHVRLMGEVLARGEKYPMFEEEPEHCGASLLVTVELLFKARDEIRRLKAKANVEITNAPAVDFGAFGGATGSLPVSRAETLLARWQKRFLTYGGCLDDLQICMAELRREMARATRTLNAE